MMEKIEAGENVKKIDHVIKDLLENSTIHGVSQVSSSKRIKVKIFWFCVFVAAIVLFSVQLNGLIKEYNSNPTQTTIQMQSGSLKFPAITLCNMNAVKQSTVNLHDQLSELVNADIRRTEQFASESVRANPLHTDIYELILNGYSINNVPTDFFPPPYSYWELIFRMRRVYNFFNSKQQKTDRQMKVLSRNELLMLIGEQTEVTNPTTTPEPTTTQYLNLETDSQHLEGSSTPDSSNRSRTTSPASKPSETSTDEAIQEIFLSSSPIWDVTLSKLTYKSHPLFDNYFKGILDKSQYEFPLPLWRSRTTLFEAILRQQTRDFRFHLGHQFEDIVLSSHFAGVQENVTYKRYWTSDYGNCYTIDSPKYETPHSGPGHGFDFLLNLEMDEYIPNIQESQGVRVVLHEQGTVPFPKTEGVTLAPGYEHQIGLRVAETSRLGHPYGHCTDGQQFYNKYKTRYSQNTCTEICKIEMYVNECGCMPNDSTEILDKYVDLPVCKFSMDSSVKACAEKLHLELNRDGESCDCAEPCRTTSYLKTISGRPWPADNYLTSVIVDSLCEYRKRILPSMVHICEQHSHRKLDVQKYRNNFMKIQIYFEDTHYQLMAEEPTYGIVRFLSDIGGTAGLFVGASVISIVEILQVLLEIMKYLLKRRKESPEPKVSPEPENQDRNDTVIEITNA